MTIVTEESRGPAEDTSAAELRRRAEEIAWAMGEQYPEAHSLEEARHLLHELQVHQIELEMQNEELRRTQEALEAARVRYFDLYDLAPVGYVTLSEQGLILEANLRAATLLGESRGQLVGRRLSEFVAPEDQDIYYRHRKPLFETGAPLVYELRMARQDGAPFWAQVEMTVTRDAESGAVVCRTTLSDITARKLAEDRLFAEKELAQITLASIGDGVITTDAAGRVESMNPMAEVLVGLTVQQAQGQLFASIFRAVDELTRNPIADPVQEVLRTGKVTGFSNPVVLLRRDGQEIYVADSAAPMRDRQGRTVGAVTVFRDVTAQHLLSRAVAHQATHDALTGLVNRTEFERRLTLMLEHARQHRREHALCYLDLDHFKVVNDTCGHGAGDELLRQLTMLLKTRVRERDTLARLGGDEFGLLLGECPLAEALSIAHALRELVQDFRFIWQQKTFRVGASIGLVAITATDTDLASILSAADSACYVAKEQGRNRVHVDAPGDRALGRRQNEMRQASRLEEAGATDRLRLYYQPIVALDPRNPALIYGEVLLRFADEDGQILLPLAFIPAAERYCKMLAIDRWVVRSLSATLRGDTLRSVTDDCFSVNLSGQSLSNHEFLDFVMKQLEENGVSPTRICFEITETAVIANLAVAGHFIATLRAKGCRFALDDFGSGLSSFAYLKTLPVDFLKIDGCFVQNMVNDPIDCAMVEAIQRVGSVMGIKTIAESVENMATLDLLKAIGVDYAQGYALGRPRPLAEVVLGRVHKMASGA
jgi:Amt family ammonium transporter